MDLSPDSHPVAFAFVSSIAELNSRLTKRLSFGTAGLRAAMGAGSAFLNDLTVIQASQGLLRYLRLMFPDDIREKGIVVGKSRVIVVCNTERDELQDVEHEIYSTPPYSPNH